MFYSVGKQAAALQYGLGALAGGLGGLALQMLLDRDLRNELLQQGTGTKIHPQTIADAAQIAPLLKHLDPATARIGIGGLPGTGKTEMASELARNLGMKHHDADLSLGKAPVPPGSVAERYDMLVNNDPEQFDALMHLKRPGSGRGPETAKLLNLPAVEQASQHQFAAARGKELHPTETAWMKLKPQEGFGTKSLNQSFVDKGYVAKKLAPGLLGSVAGLIAAHLLKK